VAKWISAGRTAVQSVRTALADVDVVDEEVDEVVDEEVDEPEQAASPIGSTHKATNGTKKRRTYCLGERTGSWYTPPRASRVDEPR
jgi:hypothetical protein